MLYSATAEIEDYGDRVRTARKALQLTQQQVADRLLVHRQTIVAYETNKQQPRRAMRKRLEAMLHMNATATPIVETQFKICAVPDMERPGRMEVRRISDNALMATDLSSSDAHKKCAFLNGSDGRFSKDYSIFSERGARTVSAPRPLDALYKVLDEDPSFNPILICLANYHWAAEGVIDMERAIKLLQNEESREGREVLERHIANMEDKIYRL